MITLCCAMAGLMTAGAGTIHTDIRRRKSSTSTAVQTAQATHGNEQSIISIPPTTSINLFFNWTEFEEETNLRCDTISRTDGAIIVLIGIINSVGLLLCSCVMFYYRRPIQPFVYYHTAPNFKQQIRNCINVINSFFCQRSDDDARFSF